MTKTRAFGILTSTMIPRNEWRTRSARRSYRVSYDEWRDYVSETVWLHIWTLFILTSPTFRDWNPISATRRREKELGISTCIWSLCPSIACCELWASGDKFNLRSHFRTDDTSPKIKLHIHADQLVLRTEFYFLIARKLLGIWGSLSLQSSPSNASLVRAWLMLSR